MDARPPSTETVDLREYLEVMLKWRWLIVACLVIIFTTVAVHTWTTTPVYQATVRISIERENPQILSIEEVLQMDAGDGDYLLSQVDILQSRSLAHEVIRRENLEQDASFLSGGGGVLSLPRRLVGAALRPVRAVLAFDPDEHSGAWSQWVGAALRPLRAVSALDPDEAPVDSAAPLYSPLVGVYRAHLSVEPVRRTRLIDVRFASTSPQRAAAVANSHVQAYIDKNLELRFQATQDALVWLNQRLADVKNDLSEAERALQQFREEEDIVSLGDIMSFSRGDGRRDESLVQQRIQELSAAVTRARIERLELENLQRRVREIQAADEPLLASFPEVINNDLIRSLKQDLARTLRRQSELQGRYGPRHPAMLTVQAEIEQQEARLRQEMEAVLQSISAQYNIAFSRERSLAVELQRETNRAQQLTRKSVQYSVLQREVESNRNLYDTLLNRVKETALTSGLETSNVKIIDRADVPGAPVRPRTGHNLVLGLLGGLGLGIGLAFFLEHLDSSIESPAEAEKHLNVPFLGSVGYVKDLGSIEDQAGGKGLYVLADSKSAVAESLRNIRTYLSFRLRGRGEKSFVIASANPAEGKTLFAANMAVLLAAAEKRTVLVSADLRKPRLAALFSLEQVPGLSDALVGDASPEAVIRDTGIPYLSCVPAGTIMPNPAELLTSEKMGEFHALLEERFDIVLYDTPPILMVTDAVICSQIAGNVVLVVSSGKTDRKAARRVIQQLNEVEATILGVVLNEANYDRRRYYGHYDGRYYGRYHTEYGDQAQSERSDTKSSAQV